MKKTAKKYHQQFDLSAQQALSLSDPIIIKFPQPQQIKQSIFSTVASYIKFSKQEECLLANKVLLPVPNEHFVMAQGNSICICKYWQSQNQQLLYEIQCQHHLSFNVKTVKVSPFAKLDNDHGFYLIVEDSSSNYLQILHYQIATQIGLKPITFQKIPSRINCWSFIHKKQILIWCQNMKLYHYQLKNNGIKLIQDLDTGISIAKQSIISGEKAKEKIRERSKSKSKIVHRTEKNAQPTQSSKFQLNFSSILGQRCMDQDSTIVLFYVLYNSQMNGMKIKCKQIIYPLQSEDTEKNYSFLAYKRPQFPKLKIKEAQHEIASHNTADPQILNTLNISQIDQAFLIKFQFQIIVVQKRFEQYYAVSNIYKKNKDCKVSMASNSNIVSCFTDKILQLNRIAIKDKNIVSTMIDFIDLEYEYNKVKSMLQKQENQIKIQLSDFSIKVGKMMEMWVSTDINHDQRRKNLYFVFQVKYKQNQKQKQIYIFYLTSHMPKVKKLTQMAKRSKDQKDIIKIQKLGQNLGVDSSQFYYNMWKSSEQGPQQIVSYLLKCKQYKKILTQLKGFLRRRTYVATRLLKVLQGLQTLTLNILKQSLTEQHLIDYLHVVFVNKKFQIFQSNYAIDQRQFTQMVQISLYDLVKQKIIMNTLSPAKKNTSVWTLQPKQAPKLSLIQVLDIFKLPLLQNYDQFLRDILNEHPDAIIKIIYNFSYLLPVYPLQQIEVVVSNNVVDPLLQTTRKLKSMASEVQRQFFTSIKQQQLKSDANFLEHTLKELYPYYSTSLILKSFDQVMNRIQMKNQKFKFHSVIEVKYDVFKQKIKYLSKFNGIFLYVVTLDCLVKQSQKQQIYPCGIVQLCQIFKLRLQVPDDVKQQLQVMASLYELMIYHNIIDINQVGLQNLFIQPIQKWIALFFLGNKQQKQLIFNEFKDIFGQNNQRFLKTIQKFVYSQHCSKIQLIILIDLITQMSKQFQRNNQQIIQAIIDGFCARVHISDIDDTSFFKKRLRTVQLGHDLLIKADKIEKAGLCRRILSTFYLQDTLLKDLLDNTIQIIDKMLQNFFEDRIKQPKIELSNKRSKSEIIQIKQVKNMFQLLHYMRENIFYNIQAQQLLKVFCKKMIYWQQFDQIHTLLYQSRFIQQYQVDRKKLIQQIQSETLQQLYKIQIFRLTSQNKSFVKNILQIDNDPADNQIVIYQKAKMSISDMFLQWKVSITMAQLESMCKEWTKFQQHDQLNKQSYNVMDDIIQKYADFLDVQKLRQLYMYFTIATTHKTSFEPGQLQTQQYYTYCTSLCDALIVRQRYKQASQIICIINEYYQMNYMIMAKCFLKSLSSIYLTKAEKIDQSQINFAQCESQVQQNSKSKHQSDSNNEIKLKQNNQIKVPIFSQFLFKQNQNNAHSDEQSQALMCSQMEPLEIIKKFIDIFAINWEQADQEAMKSLFQNYFSFPSIQNISDILQIAVNQSNCFNQFLHKVKTRQIWDLVQKVCRAEKYTDNDMISGYFFLIIGLIDPDSGFSKISYISYNHSILVTILQKFKDQCDRNNDLLFINYQNIFQLYLDALTQFLVSSHNQKKDEGQGNQTHDQKSQNESSSYVFSKNLNLSVVRDELLKNNEYKTDPLTNSIIKMKALAQQAQKGFNKRLSKYNHTYASVRKFDLTLQKNLKMTTMRRKMLADNQFNNIDNASQGPKAHNQKTMMSFQQFKRMKNNIKNDHTLTMNLSPDLNITERVIVQSIFNKIEPQSRSSHKKVEIPELDKIIAASLQQQKKRQEQQERIMAQMNNKQAQGNQEEEAMSESVKLQSEQNKIKEGIIQNKRQSEIKKQRPKNFFQALVNMSKN